MNRVFNAVFSLWIIIGLAAASAASAMAAQRDLAEIQHEGVLRHLGIPYANFVTGTGDGLDVEMIKGFARYLGVRYEFVATDWARAFGELTGEHARRKGSDAERFGASPVKGDLIANGMTILEWRQQVVSFSEPTFPSGVWLLARAESTVKPILPSGLLATDILETKSRLDGVSVLALANTCLDPGLYDLASTRAEIRMVPKQRKLNEMVPALLNLDGETTLLDVPDALIALQRWPGQVKVVGPISEDQRMAVAFRPTSPELRDAFNRYLAMIRKDGSYNRLVERYYPSVFDYFDDFFE
jgi:ABC-type amino acid transport substrate-binding protein